MSEPRDWRELATGYALGILDADERALFEKHLDTASAREVDELAAIAGLLGTAVPRMVPPTGLRNRILTEARGDAPAAASELTGGPAISPVRWTSGWAPLLAASVALLAVLVLYSGQRQRTAAVGRQLEQLGAELQDVRALAEQRQRLIDTLLDSEIRVAALAAPDAQPTMRLFWNPRRGVALVTAFNLAPAAPGQTYQLWGIDTAAGTAPVSLGTFDTAADQRAVVTLTVPSTISFDLAAVTVEPVGGSSQPTTAPFLVGNLSTN
jgi:anti-sigma-K factor RskA